MTSETQTPGSVPPLPPWIYWSFMALAAALPTLIVSGVVPSPWSSVLAAINAGLAVLTGTSRPAPAAERVALAAKRRSDKPPSYYAGTLLALAALGLGASGCSLRFGGPGVEVGGTAEPEWTADDCRSYDDAFVGLTAAAAVAGGLGGAAGVALASWTDAPEDAVIGLGASTVFLGAAAAILGTVASLYAERFAERCTAPLDWPEPAEVPAVEEGPAIGPPGL